MHTELWLMHRSCVPASRSTRKPSPWLRGSHHPILCRSDSQICRFWCLNNQCATLHHQHIAFHQLRITALGPSRHGIGSHPAVAHPQPTLQAEELYRRALTGREDQLGAVHPQTLQSVYNLAKLLEDKGSFAEAGFGRLGSGDVDVGSWWKLNKWPNSDALLKGTDLTGLGKSVVKIQKVMFSNVFFL